MPALNDLKDQMRKAALDAHAIVADPDKTPAEKREALDKVDPVIAQLEKDIADLTVVEERGSRYAALSESGDPADPEPHDEPKGRQSVGEQIANSQEYKNYVAQLKLGGRSRSGAVEVQNAALGTGDIGADVIAPQRQPGILPILFERLTVADLMPSANTGSNTVRYVVETTATNAASTVAEKGTKPEAALDFDTVDEPVRKIAVVFKMTDELMEDFDQFTGYVNGRLVLFVRIREEQQLLSGAGTGNDIDGLLNRSLTAAQPKGGDTIAIAVHKEITKVRVASFLDPTGIVFHPNDWEAARLEQDQNDQFYGGGPFTGPYGNGGIAVNTYWGLPTVVTQAMTENTILLGAFSTAAQVFRRSGITVDMTNSDGDDFLNNITTLRAEERLALAVYRPAAFGTVTGV